MQDAKPGAGPAFCKRGVNVGYLVGLPLKMICVSVKQLVLNVYSWINDKTGYEAAPE